VATESLTVETLNSQRIYPKSDGEKLSAGRGQYVSGMALVVDESGMSEGKLGDMGVRNLRFLSRISSLQKIGFEFPFHEFEIDTDVTFLVLGSSKSILPVRSTPFFNLISWIQTCLHRFPLFPRSIIPFSLHLHFACIIFLMLD
jgi:hypothetical protein